MAKKATKKKDVSKKTDETKKTRAKLVQRHVTIVGKDKDTGKDFSTRIPFKTDASGNIKSGSREINKALTRKDSKINGKRRVVEKYDEKKNVLTYNQRGSTSASTRKSYA